MKKILMGLLFTFVITSAAFAGYVLKIETDIDKTMFLLKPLPSSIIVTLYSDEKQTTQLCQETFYRKDIGIPNQNLYRAEIILKFDEKDKQKINSNRNTCTLPMEATHFTFNFKETNTLTTSARPWYVIRFFDKNFNYESPIAQIDQDAWENFCAKIEGTPVGTIIPWATSKVPAGFLAADGSAVSRTDYPRLFAVIGTIYGAGNGSTTFNLPDLRGIFLRGIDNGKGIDPEGVKRTVGSIQKDAFQGHWHSGGGNPPKGDMEGWSDIRQDFSPLTTLALVSDPCTDNKNGEPRTASETRPQNIAVLYAIKY